MEKDIDIRALLSSNMKRARNNLGLSQLALANLIQVSPNFINAIEQGKKWASPETLQKICKSLSIPAHHLFLPDFSPEIDKDASIKLCLDEIELKTKAVIDSVRREYLG